MGLFGRMGNAGVARRVVASARLLVKAGKAADCGDRRLNEATLDKFDEMINLRVVMSTDQARNLAKIAVALLNYDVRHVGDNTRILFDPFTRNDVIRLIRSVDPELIDDLHPLDQSKMRAKIRRIMNAKSHSQS